MTKITVAAMALFLVNFLFAQKVNVAWGDEFKLKRGSTDLAVICADKTGIYVKESHYALKSYFVIGATLRESASLIKLDKNLTELYKNDFNKELKGKEYEQFFFIKNKLYLLATDYSKRDKTLTLFGAEIDKNTGDLNGEWQEIARWQKEEKSEDISFKASCNADSSKIVLISTILGKEKNNYQLQEFDISLKATTKPTVISNEFDPKIFQLEDVIYANNGNVVMVGRKYQYEEGKKKKAKFLEFVNYNIRIHDSAGRLVKELNTEINGKWLISSKVLQMPGKELVLAAFYSNAKKSKEINGILVQRINVLTGEVINTNQQDINTSMISNMLDDDADDDGDDESKKERKERKRLEKIQNEEDGFSKNMCFRNIIYTPDSGLVILAEKYESYFFSSITYDPGAFGSMGHARTTLYQAYECGDLLMSKIDSGGAISWIHILPKHQREIIQDSSYSNTGFSVGVNFFYPHFNMPFYSGFGVVPLNNSINILLNDHKKNAHVLQLGQKAKKINYFRTADCYIISLDMGTGNYTRKFLFSNDDTPTAMPRLGSVWNNTFYMVGKEDRMFGKTKIAIGKAVFKN